MNGVTQDIKSNVCQKENQLITNRPAEQPIKK